MKDDEPFVPNGPVVADDETLFRCLTFYKWYNHAEKRVSSAAFSFPRFSVEIASISGSAAATLAPFLAGTGLASIHCGFAKSLGCDPRQEKDEIRPDNEAHAHVYMPAGDKRKSAAKKLAESCEIVVIPNLAEPD